MAHVSTHVLDTARGRPAGGVAVRLETAAGNVVGTAHTDDDGRVAAVGPPDLDAGEYRLRFATGDYFDSRGVAGFYPEVVIVFRVSADEKYHVPLLLNPFGYSTYRGS